MLNNDSNNHYNKKILIDAGIEYSISKYGKSINAFKEVIKKSKYFMKNAFSMVGAGLYGIIETIIMELAGK